MKQNLGLVVCLVIALGVVVEAYCPNGCNAQGTCGSNDKCTCYMRQDDTDSVAQPMFIGADCSLRTCPRGFAWVDIATGAAAAHARAECSNRGMCDRTNGICACFPGYEGKACERTVCPNQCSHHGICTTLASIILQAPSSPGAYTGWDASKNMGCICDLGYRGPDCSIKECPSGSDVLLGYGSTEGRDCGGRGKCDTETGICSCFPGYYGTYCSYQSTVH